MKPLYVVLDKLSDNKRRSIPIRLLLGIDVYVMVYQRWPPYISAHIFLSFSLCIRFHAYAMPTDSSLLQLCRWLENYVSRALMTLQISLTSLNSLTYYVFAVSTLPTQLSENVLPVYLMPFWSWKGGILIGQQMKKWLLKRPHSSLDMVSEFLYH